MNFREILYKNPDYQKPPENEPSAEALALSERVAKEKLAKLNDPAFRRFSVRYMNIEEYRQMVEEGKFGGSGGGEVSVFDLDSSFMQPPDSVLSTFPMFAHYPREQTNWNTLEEGMWTARTLLQEIKKVERESKGVTYAEKLQKLREALLGFIMRRQVFFQMSIVGSPDELIEREPLTDTQKEQIETIRERIHSGNYSLNREELKKEARRLKLKIGFLQPFAYACEDEAIYGKENMRIISRLRSDPQYLEEPGALREIANAISYAVDKGHHGINGEVNGWSKERQYQLAVVFDNEALGIRDKGYSGHNWGDVRQAEDSTPKEQLGRGIVAAFSIMRIKELEEEMARMSQSAREFAHPVFGVLGEIQTRSGSRPVLRWPRTASE